MKKQNSNDPGAVEALPLQFLMLGSRRVVLMRDFAQQVYDSCGPSPSRPVILSSLSRAGFDTDMQGFCLDETLYASFVNHGRPTDCLELTYRIPKVPEEGGSEGSMTTEELVATGFFYHYRNGIRLSESFVEELYEKYPAQSIPDGMRAAGLDPEAVGTLRIKKLAKSFEERRAKESQGEGGSPGNAPAGGASQPSEKDAPCPKGEAPGDPQAEQSGEAAPGAMPDEELLATGLFTKSKNGISFSQDFEKELYGKYPEKTIEEGLSEHGLTSEGVGPARIWRLKKRFEALDGRDPDLFFQKNRAVNHWVYSDDTLRQYRSHPYIASIEQEQLKLAERFYDEAAFMAALPMEDVLDVFQIPHGLFTRSQLADLRQSLEGRPLVRSKEPGFAKLTSYTSSTFQTLCRRMAALDKALKLELDALAKEVPRMSLQGKRDLFKVVMGFGKDPCGWVTRASLIESLGVSKNSFYSIARLEGDIPDRPGREWADERDAAIIRRVFEYKGFAKGARQVYMMLPDLEKVHFGLNKVRRLMEKYGMCCHVREANPARQRGKAIQARAKENLVRRKFRLFRPNQVRLTDVTYLTLKDGKRAYGSALLDPVTSKLVCFNVSERNDMDLVMETIRLSKENEMVQGGVLHSDQGSIYLSLEFQQEIERIGFVQSMSKRGNCLDNSPVESFFGHFKDEVNISDLTFSELVPRMEEFVEYYNGTRRLWDREHMTPLEYEAYLTGMTEEEFQKYLARESQRYAKMKEEAARKAVERAKTLGVDGVGPQGQA